ncbi:hypothetical protein [Winogradskyella psychrotolerans]|uniref:hypothetical protein n=1 Tax=Winogradskyella psychrotolerans TaxID=1344585 RepID=UPI001C07C479|nr:hypothetical protein [Winogradskyella psychrotolerans]MBU2930053.1 hypothetical protein [Winogradskyella psychrotolerans]
MFIFASINKGRLMLVNKILKVVLVLLGISYVLLQGFALQIEGDAVSAVAFVLLIWLYMGWTKRKSKLFILFLVVFAVAQVLGFLACFRTPVPEGQIDYLYFLTNILSIVSYTVLIVKLFIQLNFKKVLSQLTVPIIILVILDIFCVTLISSTTKSSFTYYEYALEFTYNAVVMILLSFALINYMYRNNYKSMLFLLGSIFIVFSEIIQLAYYYILIDGTNSNLGYIYSFFLVVAFIFYYLQSQHAVSEPIPAYTDDPIDA